MHCTLSTILDNSNVAGVFSLKSENLTLKAGYSTKDPVVLSHAGTYEVMYNEINDSPALLLDIVHLW